LLAVVSSFTNNQLSIIGDGANDTVVISTVDVGGVEQVTVNGQSVGAGGNAASVRSISAKLGGGNDTMNLSTLDLRKFSGLANGSVTIDGEAGNDVLTGTSLGDILIGGAGNDTLVGGAGDDTLDGGAGDDMYSFSGTTNLGSDTVVQAASGNLDTLQFANLGGAIVIDISMTTPQVVRTGQLTLTLGDANGIDNVQGTAYDDVLLGNSGGNSLMGNGGNDLLWGRGGNDWLDGGAGNDTLYGGDGDDTLLGKGGNDFLYGHAGNDTLNGNEGNDYLSGDDGDDTYLVTNYGAKTIAGAAGAAGAGSDRVDVSGQTLTGALDLSSTSVQTIAASLSVRFTAANAVEWILGGAKNQQVSAAGFAGGFYTVPGEIGTTTMMEFRYGGALAAYDNGLFVFDATDPINRYAARPRSEYLFTGNVTTKGETKQLQFIAGSRLGFFIEQNGSPGTLFFSEDARNDNDIATDSDRNHVGAADLGAGRVQLSWEDLYYVLPNPDDYIFDGDYNDLFLSVQAVSFGVNHAPVITSNGGGTATALEVSENQTAVTTVVATDPEVPSQVLTYSVTGGVDQALFTIVPATGVLSFLAAPDYEEPTDVGGDNVYDVEVTVTDSFTPALSDTQHISVVVANVNEAPVVNSVSDQQSMEGATVSMQIDATDPEGDALSYAAVNLPGGLTIDANTGLITGKIAFTAAGVYSVTVTVTDSGSPAESADLVFQWTVDDAFVDFLIGREWVAGAPTLNSVRSVDMTFPALFVSAGHTVGLVVGSAEHLPPDLSDVLFSVVGGPTGTFAAPPTITPSPAATIHVVVGIDMNQNGVLDPAEQTHSIAIGPMTLGAVTFKSQRTVGPNAELAAFEIRAGDYFEVDGTFEFTMTPGAGANLSPMAPIRYDIVDQDAFWYRPLQSGGGLSFTYTFTDWYSKGDVYIRLYVDANRDGVYNSGEDYIDSDHFRVQEVKVWEFGIWYPDSIANPSASIASLLELDEGYVMRRDTAADFRGLVDFRLVPARSGAGAYAYTPGGTVGVWAFTWPTPGPVTTEAEAEALFDAAPDWTIIVVEAFTLPDPLTGLPEDHYGLAEDIGGGANEIIFNMSLRGDDTLAHEIGHLAGISHHGPNDYLMQDGIYRVRPANLLTLGDAREYTNG